MKRIIFALIIQNATVMTKAQQISSQRASFASPNFKWEKTTIDLGQIKLNQPTTAQFTFTNSGGGTLIISEVKPSCSCTVPEYTKEPVQAGKKGIVKAEYKAASLGKFNKTVTVISNSEGGTEMLTIFGEVIE